MPIAQALFVPEIANLLTGFDYDMVMTDQATHENIFTEHPIEDPQRSFLMDHNRERPTQLQFRLIVSSNPTTGPRGVYRLSLFYERLLWMKGRQSVALDAFLTVYTGIKFHQNMAIKSIRMNRTNETGNQAEFDISLHEFRFATYPSLSSGQYLMSANNGAYNGLAAIVVSPGFSMITRATRVRQKPRIARPENNQLGYIRTAALLAL